MQDPSSQAVTPVFRHVDSDHGVQWWGTAWRWLFRGGAAGVWIAMCLISFVILAFLHIVPVLGWMAAQIGFFVFAGGLMLAARKTDQGSAPAIGELFAGFGPQLSPLAVGGVLVMIAVLLIGAAATVAGIGAVVGAAYGVLSGNIGALVGVSAFSALVALIALIVLIPVAMATWLSPALIVLRHQPPVAALKASMSACWANMGALTIYGLLWIVFAFLATVPVMLGWLLLWPLMVLSTYAAYQDLFETASATAAGAPQ